MIATSHAGALLGACCALFGCGANGSSPEFESISDGPVSIVTTAQRYSPGDPVAFSVTNGASDTLVWNPCVHRLDRLVKVRWRAVDDSGRICPMIGWILHPDERVEANTNLPEQLGPGEYRLRYSFAIQSSVGGELQQVSNSFVVEP